MSFNKKSHSTILSLQFLDHWAVERAPGKLLFMDSREKRTGYNATCPLIL